MARGPAVAALTASATARRGEVVPRAASDARAGRQAESAVQATLRESGLPLDSQTREVMETYYHHDFAAVRIHSDASAHRAATVMNSLAFTAGDHVIFAHGYQPTAPAGRSLLAHELAHVAQQRTGPVAGHPVSDGLQVSDPEDPYERAADVAAAGVGLVSKGRSLEWRQPDGWTEAGGRYSARTITIQRTPVRRDLLLAGDEQTDRPMRGNDAHRAITETFMRDVGPFARLTIPSGSRAPFLTEECSTDSEPTTVSPLIYNNSPRSRQGIGIPDLVFRQPGRIELAEIKPASHSCVVFGEMQVANYVDKGTGDEGHGSSPPAIPGTRFSIMPPSRWQQLPHHERLQNVNLTYDWVGNGVVGYLATRSEDRDILLCGVDDAGKIDAFIQNASTPALEVIDTAINVELNRTLTRLIDGLSLQQMLERVLGRQIAAQWLSQLDDALRRQIELQLRSVLHSFKDRLVREVTQRLRAQLRQILTELVTIACVAGLVLTTRELLRLLRTRARVAVWDEALVVATVMLQEAVRSLAQVALAAAVLVIASLLIALLLLDDASGIGVADDPLIAPLAAAAAWAARLLAAAAEALLPLLRLAAAASPALTQGEPTLGSPEPSDVGAGLPAESTAQGGGPTGSADLEAAPPALV